MNKIQHVVFVSVSGNDWSEEARILRNWAWCRSPFTRWILVTRDSLTRTQINTADLFVLDWPAEKAEDAQKAYRRIRRKRRTARILVIKTGRDDWRDKRVPDKKKRGIKENSKRAAMDRKAYAIQARGVKCAFLGACQALRFSIPLPSLQLGVSEKDLGLTELREWIKRDPPENEDPSLVESREWVEKDGRLKLIIQKFFPNAKRATVTSVRGGWSGAHLCQFYIVGKPELYFLKFSEKEAQYKLDFENHIEAQKWLKGATVDLNLVPDQDPSFEGQLPAFPLTTPCLLPLCFTSASTYHRPRETLQALYRTKSLDFLEQAVQQSMGVLAPKKRCRRRFLSPWSDQGDNPNDPDEPFHLSTRMERNVHAVMEDLEPYGSSFCQDTPRTVPLWNQLRMRIENLFGARLHKWLTNRVPVRIGHTHGDPNPRNCLVDPSNPLDLKWIDCGDYRPDGRLVSDLAIMERDIKLVLLGTEQDGEGFFDLDVNRIPSWCEAERDSIEQRINYTTPKPGTGIITPTYRAYRLIELVRMQARKLDPRGIHYFAALLFWTLDALKYRTSLRPTKQLLALYSASEILKEFGS